mgnify:CR=1 FL=1
MFWYGIIQLSYILLVFILFGLKGLIFCLLAALFSVLMFESVNYIEHYGLSRQKIDDEKYEPTKPFHSWNANHAASNLLLINLQKHSDHHARPNKTYPLLSAYDQNSAPQLPFGYPIMVVLSLIPFLWRKVINMKIGIQGELGAYSHIAVENLYKDAVIKTCATFEETFKQAYNDPDYKIVIPIENSLAGRVAYIKSSI